MPRHVAMVGAGFLVATGVTFGAATLLPQADWVAFIVAFVSWVVTGSVMSALSGRGWLALVAFVPAALVLIAASMLPAELALDETGKRVRVTVVEHQVTHSWVSGDRTTEHRYVVERADGTPLGEDLATDDGLDGVDEGDTVTVLVDPEGKVPVRPASRVDPGAGVGVLVVGMLGMIAVLLSTALIVRRDGAVRPAG